MREDVLWAAGLLEGEGTFRYNYKKGSHASFQVSIGSRDQDVVERLASIFDGGDVFVTTLNGAPFYNWAAAGRKGYAVMVAVYPFMGQRRRGAIEKAIAAWRAVPVGNKWKTHCNNGHEFTKENTIIRPGDKGRRRCRICHNDYQRRTGR